MLSPSAVESARFGFKVYRCKQQTFDAKAFIKAVHAARADLVVLRLPTGEREALERLRRAGLPALVADTLVYYTLDYEKHDPRPLRNEDLRFEVMTEAHRELLEGAVEEIFPAYRNHYDVSPYISRDGFMEGYKEWAMGHAEGCDPGKIAWVVHRGEQFVGFCNCSHDVEAGVSEMVLFGVAPGASGGGVYGDMIRFTSRYYKDQGYQKIRASTQVENFAVQKVWAREGFLMDEALMTIHVNAFMSHSVLEPFERTFRVSAESIEAFGEASGDRNTIHFDDEAARAQGFEGRIAHGLIVQAEISRILGVERPGPGTLILGTASTFLAPVYPDRDYQLRVGFPHVDEKHGVVRAVVTLREEAGKLCLLGASDLMKRDG